MPFDRQKVNEIFDAAVELTEPERARFLDRECAGDPELRAEVESLLASDLEASGFIETPILSIPPEYFPEATSELVGQRLGAYRIITEIGRGGLGTVYLAERSDETYRKEVAIKLIRRGLDTEDILRRFRNERQILAQLEHPNIARLLDAGTTGEGLPYFVMEYVQGVSLTKFCDARQLDIAARLQLFRQVCQAVTYAHQNLVIHRDLKPSNILVTEEGIPKLLDFGIAKVLTSSDTEEFTQTIPGLRVMTPGYASPEQMKGDRITTSSDVYSLGVILYELLTGKRPYRLTNDVSAEEVSHAIAEQELERPSTAVLQDSRLVGQDSHSLRGDLDNIVLMALRKEPERRYNSAAALAEDIERYHTGLPVVAHQDSLTYRVSKFVRRHKAGVIAAVLVLLAILAGMTGTLWQSHLARVQRAKAERRFNDVRKLATSNLFEVYPEVENLAGSLKARESILKNALQYLDSLAREAGDDLELQSELATGYEKVGDVQGALNNSNLGNIKAGLETYRKANALRAAIVAASPNDLEAKEKLARNEYTIARTLWLDSQTREAEKAFEKALKLWRELVAAKPDSPALKDKLAVTLIDYAAIPAFDGQSEKTLALANEALAIVDQLREKDPADPAYKKTKARLLRILSKPKAHLGDYAGGLKALDGALVLSKEVAQQLPNDFPAQRAVWLTQSMTCELFIDKGDGLEAVEACRGTIDFPRQALTHEPENGVIAYDLAISYFNLARACRLSRDFSQTIENSKAAMKVMEKLQATSPEETDYLRNLAVYKTEMARAQIALNQSGEAIAVLEEAEKLLQPIVEAGSESATFQEDLGMVYRLSAQAYHQKNDDENAIERVDKAITIVRKLKKQSPTAGLERNLLSELELEKASYSK